MKNLLNTEYITLENLLDSVKLDFKKYAQSGIIDDAALYKIVSKCNDEAGIRINPIEYCIAEIKNGKIELPDGLEKIKKIDIITNYKKQISLPLYENWSKTVTEKPKENEPIYTPLGCMNECGSCYWVVPYKNKTTEEYVVFSEYNSITPSNDCSKLSKNEYFINRDEQIIQFGVQNGKVILCYYVNLDSLGLIPKKSQLYFYYEWSIKLKILQDIFMNSEDDVINKIKYAEQELQRAYIDFDNYIKSISYRQSRIIYKKREEEFFNTWLKPFYV